VLSSGKAEWNLGKTQSTENSSRIFPSFARESLSVVFVDSFITKAFQTFTFLTRDCELLLHYAKQKLSKRDNYFDHLSLYFKMRKNRNVFLEFLETMLQSKIQ